MAKVVPLFKYDSVQSTLCEAADIGLTEIILIGKKKSGGFWIRMSPIQNAYELVGMAVTIQHELMTALQEESEG